MRTIRLLRTQDGFVRDYVLEEPSSEQTSTIVTVVEWESKEVIARVAQAVADFHKASGLNVEELLGRLGITMERGSYGSLDENLT